MKQKAGIFLYGIISCVLVLKAGCAGVTPAPTYPAYTIPPALKGVNDVFNESVQGHIAYNTPADMQLEETLDIQLLLSPIISAAELKKQIVELGELTEAQIEVTPLMKAELKSADSAAFDVKAMHDSPDQVVLGASPTEWRWSITAKKAGDRLLTLVLYRQVEYNKQFYWTIVETYRNTIHITVTPQQWLQNFDWKWLAGIVLTAVLIPALWRLIDRKKKKTVRKTRPSD